MDMVEIYFEIVHPIFPFFHQPTTVRRVSRGEYLTNRSFFAVTMAMCALCQARVRDGAVFSSRWDLTTLKETSSETLYAASENAIARAGADNTNLDYLRAYAVLSIAAIQYGDPRKMRYYLGLYHTAVEIDRLHDETSWPPHLGVIETEERRRLFWSMYTLDVYAAIVWNGVVRSREAQANVAYPAAVNDEEISDTGYGQAPLMAGATPAMSPGSVTSSSPSECWLYGWNMVTDLYRVLEHVIDHFRQRRPEHRVSTQIDAIFGQHSIPSSAVLEAVLKMYQALPPRFKETPTASNAVEHRLNFQTANIAATIQLVRMMLFAAEEQTVEQRCCVARELLQAFTDVPVIYLRAISSPLLHHLAGIGSLLGSVFEKGLPESSYQQIRSVLSEMVQLLANLELGLYCAGGASSRIQSLVDRLDEYVQTQRVLAGASMHLDRETQDSNALALPYLDPDSPLYLLPPELMENWSWAFNFTQPGV